MTNVSNEIENVERGLDMIVKSESYTCSNRYPHLSV
jgi:hypothetical protein